MPITCLFSGQADEQYKQSGGNHVQIPRKLVRRFGFVLATVEAVRVGIGKLLSQLRYDAVCPCLDDEGGVLASYGQGQSSVGSHVDSLVRQIRDRYQRYVKLCLE